MFSPRQLKGKKKPMVQSIQVSDPIFFRSMSNLDSRTKNMIDSNPQLQRYHDKRVLQSQTIDGTTPKTTTLIQSKSNFDFAFMSPQNSKNRQTNKKIESQNQLLKAKIQQLSMQNHQLRCQQINITQSKQKVIGEIYKQLNLKLSIKNTLVSQIKKIIIDFQTETLKNRIEVSKPCSQKMAQILSLIANCQHNILIKESVFQNKMISDKVVIVYREEDAENWRPWKSRQNKSNQEESELKIQSQRKDQKDEDISIMRNQLEMMKNQAESLKRQLEESQRTIQNMNQERMVIMDQKIQAQAFYNEISKLKSQMVQYQLIQQNILKERQNISLERLKYKETVQKLQSKLLYSTIQLENIKIMKDKILEYEEMIKKLNQQIMAQKVNIYALTQENQAHRISLKNVDELHQALKRAEQFIQNLQDLKVKQYQQICEYKSKYESQVQFKQFLTQQIDQLKASIKVNTQKSQKQISNHKQDQYFRYKADPRYKQVLVKLFDLKKMYNTQANSAKQFVMKYQSQYCEAEAQITSLIKSTLQQIKQFDQTVILQKSKLKRFNINKLNNIVKNLKSVKVQSTQLKQKITQQLKFNYQKLCSQILTQFAQY